MIFQVFFRFIPFWFQKRKMEWKLASWNVNGSRKLVNFPRVTAFLASLSVIFLQETFEVGGSETFSPPGYIRFAHDALETGGRPSRGSSSLFLQSKFANGSFVSLDLGKDWLLLTRWVPEGWSSGFLFLNVYFPRYSGDFVNSDADFLFEAISDLRADFPGDTMIIGGDFNFDFHRTPNSPLDR